MKLGDSVKMSHRNTNHLGYGVCAYAGMEGYVIDIYDDGSFALDCGGSTLVVPLRNAYKQKKNGVWIWLNGEHIFYKIIIKTEKRVIARMYTSYIRSSDEYEYTLIQYLQEKVYRTFLGIKLYKYWKTIDKETVPSYAWIQRNTMGSTDWKSKWSGMDNVIWIKN